MSGLCNLYIIICTVIVLQNIYFAMSFPFAYPSTSYLSNQNSTSNYGGVTQNGENFANFGAPRAKDKLNHKEYEIRDEDIIPLPIGRFPEPTCEFTVLYGGSWGWPISSANLGDPTYHQWRCSNGISTSSMYCLQVGNCTVSDGKGKSIPIIDDNGCSLDPTGTVPNVEYHNDLEGGIKTTAFSLDLDNGVVHFNCGLKLLIKENNKCTRPICKQIAIK